MKPAIINSLYSMTLPVSDVSRTVRFYRDVLGMSPRGEEGIEQEGLLMTLGEMSLKPVSASLPIHPVTMVFRVAPQNLMSIMVKMERHGINISGPEDQGDRQVLSLQDPDGHRMDFAAFCSREELSLSVPVSVKPKGRHQPDRWEDIYSRNPAHKMPWYAEKLDMELEYLLPLYAPLPGRLVELGCGHGLQSARLAAIGYDVTGIDVADSAVEHANRAFAPWNRRLSFRAADVSRSLSGLGPFDYGFDRGCFHSLPVEDREEYVQHIGEILKPGGILFVKVFSNEEPGEWGPFRFSENEIKDIFASRFRVLRQDKASFNGTLSPCRKGIMSVLKRC